MKHTGRILSGLGLTVALLAGPVTAETRQASDADAGWPQWRGPQRDGHVAGSDWPASLDGAKLRWRVPLGKGYPGPIVAGDRVFVVEVRVEEIERGARALELISEALTLTGPQRGRGVHPRAVKAGRVVLRDHDDCELGLR